MRVAIAGPGFKPIPDICGGAIEHLVTSIIEENEKRDRLRIDIYTIHNKELAKLQLKNTTICGVNDKPDLITCLKYKVKNYIARQVGGKKRFIYISEAMARAVQEGYDVIVVENNVGLFLNICEQYPEHKIVFHLHNDYGTVEDDYDKTIERMTAVCQKADLILTASDYLNSHLSVISLKQNIVTLQNCIEKSRFNKNNINEQFVKLFTKQYSIRSEEFIILYCGRFDKYKGLKELIQSVAIIPERENIQILAAGENWFYSQGEKQYEDELKGSIENYNVKVTFCGYVDQSNIQNIYSCATIVAIPSQCMEAFGMTALEAISMGKPCIATNSGGLKEILDSECAILIDMDNDYVANMAKAIKELYYNPEKVRRMGRKAEERAKLFDDTQQYYDKFVSLLKELG